MIKFIKVNKSYDDNVIFKDLNLEFHENTSYGIVGPNGYGKSVLLRLIAGFSRPDSGDIVVDGKKLGGELVLIQNAGVSINAPDFLPNESGFNNLMILASLSKVSKDKVISLCKMLDLYEKAKNTKYKNFSTGMKQKLRLIQAVMDDPDYLILDEPFSGLDQEIIIQARELVLSYKMKCKNIFITSHNSEDIELLCDEILDIRDLSSHEEDAKES